MKPLSRKQRLLNQIRGDELDRIPMLGGWNLGVRNLAALAGITTEEYLKNPMGGLLRANKALGVDAVVTPIVPTELSSIRSGSLQESKFDNVEPEALKERADAIPDTEHKVLTRFSPPETERRYREFFELLLPQLEGIELVTTLWEAPANFSLYFQYGYKAFLAATALYPDEVGRIYWEDGLLARERNRIIVRLMKEYDVVPILFCGHDICLNQGPVPIRPLVDLAGHLLLRQHFFRFRAAVGAIGIDRAVGRFHQRFEQLRVMHAGVRDGVLLNELALGIRFDVVLVAVMHLGILLGPARVHVLLPLLGRLLRPRRRRRAALDGRVFFAAVALARHVHKAGARSDSCSLQRS